MQPSLVMLLLSLLLSLEMRERLLVLSLIYHWKGIKDDGEPLPLVPMEFPERPLSADARYVLEHWEQLEKDERQWDFFMSSSMKACGQWLAQGGQTLPAAGAKELQWLKSPLLKKMETVLGASYEGHLGGEAILKISMIQDLLGRAGMRINSPGTFVRYLSNVSPPLMEIVTEGNITFRVTDAGMAEAKRLKNMCQTNAENA